MDHDDISHKAFRDQTLIVKILIVVFGLVLAALTLGVLAWLLGAIWGAAIGAWS